MSDLKKIYRSDLANLKEIYEKKTKEFDELKSKYENLKQNPPKAALLEKC